MHFRGYVSFPVLYNEDFYCGTHSKIISLYWVESDCC